MNWLCRSVFLGVIILLGGVRAACADLPKVELSIGIHRISAEVAATEASRQQGLMNRQTMPAQDGMLFVFEQNQRFCMWMKNTYLPLSVAFVDDSGAIINIADMVPQSEQSHCATKPARYALEMNVGWFEKRGLRSGSKISGLDRAPLAR